jgi:uncharacterized membrane protein
MPQAHQTNECSRKVCSMATDELPKAAVSSMDELRQWTMKRNCSATPRQVLALYLSLVAVSALIATGFWLQGATLVVPFAVVELTALGAALLVYARHATDHEQVTLTGQQLEVVWHNGGREVRQVFNPHWVRVEHHGNGLIGLCCSGVQAQVGRYTRPERRPALAADLRSAVKSR